VNITQKVTKVTFGQGDFNMAEAIAKFERQYGGKIAVWAIVAIVTYLVIAQ
jgi:hypothetical protein